jgi:sulfhydrogenase subunit gamma (sulfur reductase)
MTTTTASSSSGHVCRGHVYEPFRCRIESIADLTPSEKLFRLTRLDGEPFGHRPGQFMMVSVGGIGEAPISVSSSPSRGAFLELGVRKTGILTDALHAMPPGAELGLRGPFGTFFDVQAMKGKDLLLISGGCGLAPMRALIQYLEDHHGDYGRVTVLYGAKSPRDMLYKDELKMWQQSSSLDCRVTVDNITTGTCWDGNVGLITTLIPPLTVRAGNTIAVIVGPPIMYKFVIPELYDKGLQDADIVVSLERYMKCGVGKCGHCTIDHLYCCVDGPVFRLDQVASIKGAL